VRPCDDEVCFQCWDGKIRTSPKRKQTKVDINETHPGSGFSNLRLASSQETLAQPNLRYPALDLKVDLELDNELHSSGEASPRGSNKRAFTEDIGTHTKVESTHSHTAQSPLHSYLDNDGDKDEMLEEHEAVFLLSTAFKTFPLSPRSGVSLAHTNLALIDTGNSKPRGRRVDVRMAEGKMELDFNNNFEGANNNSDQGEPMNNMDTRTQNTESRTIILLPSPS